MPSPEADTRREEGRHLERFCRDGAPFFHGSLSLLCKDVSVQAPWMELLGWGGDGSDTVRTCLESIAFPPSLYGLLCGSGGSAGEVFTADTVAAVSLRAGCHSGSLFSCHCLQQSPPRVPALPVTVVDRGRTPCSSLRFPVPSCCCCCCPWVAPPGTFLAWMVL